MRISLTPIVVAMVAASVGGFVSGADVHAGRPDLPPVLSKGNWQRADGLLPAELVAKVKSGELEIRTQETTDLPLTPAYIEATRRNSGKVRLRKDGSLAGYVSGRPFPRIDASDPQAGLKLAWNTRYRDSLDSARSWGVFRFIDASGQIFRAIEFYYAQAYGMHRTDPSADVWKGAGILFKELYQLLEPDDVKNVMRLKFRYDDDRSSDLDFAYIPETRRVRQVPVDFQEPAISSELLNEDFYGFSGYLHEHHWRFLGRATLLAPVAVKAAAASFAPRSGYPADPWELRKMLLLEGTPKVPGHPYGKRVLYIDEQMGVPLYVLAYDRQGRHYKTIFTLYGNPAFSPGNEHVRAPLWLSFAGINHETGRAVFSQMHRIVVDAQVPEDLFTTAKLTVLAR